MSADRTLGEVNALLADAAEEMRSAWGELHGSNFDAWMKDRLTQINALSAQRRAARPVDASSKTIEELGARLGWNENEIAHARDITEAQADGFGEECVMVAHSGRELRTPAYPAPVDYMRIAQHGFELAYWSLDEVKADAEDVLGAIMGALRNGVESPHQEDLTMVIDLSRGHDRQKGLL